MQKHKIVIALGGNALGNTLPEQMAAVKVTAKAIVDLIEEGHQVIVTHGNGPQVGMINNAMAALSREDTTQPNTPLSVCVAMSQAYIGYDLQNALREELLNRGIDNIPVSTMVTQVRVNEDDPAFSNPSKPIGKFLGEEEAKVIAEKYGHIMREDAGRGWRRFVASPKPQEIVEIGAIRSLVDSGEVVIACGGGGSSNRMGNFSVRLKKLRLQRRLTQEELAPELGISRSTLGMYETGKREPDFETLETIADYFNVDMNYLIGFSNDPLDYEKIGNEEGISPPEDYEGSYEDWVRYKLQENPEYVSDNIDYIAKNTEVNPNLSLTARDKRDIKKDLDSIMKKLTSGEEGPAAYDGEPLDPEAAELFKDELEIALRRLKLINKEKYTPKKYKK